MNVETKRTEFRDGSEREDEWYWYDREAGWRVVVSDHGATAPHKFNVMLGRLDVEALDEEDRVLSFGNLKYDSKVGYGAAMARAAEFIAEAPDLV